MPEFQPDCGRGCACNNSGGCIRAGGRCKIYPLPRLFGPALVDALAPLDDKVGVDETVTVNISDLTLAEAGALVSAVLSDPIAIPADRAMQPVSLKMEGQPLSTVVQRLGLLTLS